MLLESLDAPDLHEGKMEEEEDEDIKAASPGDSDEAFSLNPNVDLSEFFTCVPGRLSLLSSTPKYCVTVGEIQRRLLPPESLNVSLLGSMLRRAKARNAGQELRGKLNTLGLRIPADSSCEKEIYEGISVPPVEEHSEAPVPSPPLFPLTSTSQPASQKMLLESLDAPDLHEGEMEEEEDEDIKAASPGDSDEAFSLNPNVDLSEFFTCVPGRLSLLSSTPKYCVTVGEIQRRLLPPESLNVSLLGSMLRRAKARNAGQELRGKLNTLGLRIPAGWRRASCPTLLTALVEAEAVMLARDFGRLCETEFPALPLAQFHHSEPEDTSTKPSERLQELLTTRKVLNRLMDTLNRDRSPLCHTSPPPLLPARVQEPMEVFSRLTHGFGTPAIVASLAAVQRYIDESAQLLHKDEP
ncbi:unnamed protein product [Cyprideis torosa]|uniref:Uncharacterized protein n=1 Tax=Cyprideis torosa TaxID=163714 RepID=A0A7R8ZP08_9CRUS|nr:unnamed protein product [Cyprideis torosa]CAG0888783.1 unnamed protein product [Cyprideis torosa]